MKKNFIKKFFAVSMTIIFLIIITFSVSAMSIYNVNGDFDEKGNEIIDIRDLVRAKKLMVQDSVNYNAVFLTELVRILLGIDELTITTNNSGGAIYLPKVP